MKFLCKFFILFFLPGLSMAQNSWSELGAATSNLFNANINAIVLDDSGNVYAAGEFTNANNYSYVVKWNKQKWDTLGAGSSKPLNANSYIYSLAVDSSGNVYAAGNFTSGGYYYVAQWNGTTWNPLGNINSSAAIYSIAADAFGNVYAIANNGLKYVAKWNGATWSQLVPFTAISQANSLATDALGNVYAIGTNGNDYVAQYKAGQWKQLGTLNATDSSCITTDPSGNVYAAGTINGSYNVAQWDGTSWSVLGNINNPAGGIDAIAADPSGNVYAATGNVVGGIVYKWDGRRWDTLGTGSNAINAGDKIPSIAVDDTGNVYAAYTSPTGTNYVAKWTNIPPPQFKNPVLACSGTLSNSDTSSLITHTGVLRWYKYQSGDTSDVGDSVITGNNTFYITQTLNGYESERALIQMKTQAPVPQPGVTSPVHYCQGDANNTLSATATGALIPYTGQKLLVSH